MDLLTHGIMGATLAQCGFQKSLGRKILLWGALAAMLPDIDVLIEVFAGHLAIFTKTGLDRGKTTRYLN